MAAPMHNHSAVLHYSLECSQKLINKTVEEDQDKIRI